MQKLLNLFWQDSPGFIFRAYVATVLVVFAVLSFASIPVCEDVLSDFLQPNYWWGVCSLFGASSLLFRGSYAGWKTGALIGDAAAVLAFLYLSYDYLTRKPPIYAGGIFAVVAALFLVGGLIHERKGKAPGF